MCWEYLRAVKYSCVEQSPSWEANSHYDTQEIPCLFWNPKVHYPIQKIPPLVPILSQINLGHDLPSSFLKIHSNIIFPSTHRSSKWTLPFRFPTKILTIFLISLMCATWHAHLIILDLITVIIFGEACKLRSSYSCSLLQTPATLSLLVPNVLLSTLFPNILNLCSSLSAREEASNP